MKFYLIVFTALLIGACSLFQEDRTFTCDGDTDLLKGGCKATTKGGSDSEAKSEAEKSCKKLYPASNWTCKED